jgi:hypothetical protein
MVGTSSSVIYVCDGISFLRMKKKLDDAIIQSETWSSDYAMAAFLFVVLGIVICYG